VMKKGNAAGKASESFLIEGYLSFHRHVIVSCHLGYAGYVRKSL